MRVETTKFLSVELCRQHPDKIFVFGDNIVRRGVREGAGQAVIRNEPNAFGVPVKRYPSMKEGSFFSDLEDEREIVCNSLRELWTIGQSGKVIVFPEDGIGTGRAMMRQKSGVIYTIMCDILNVHFGFNQWGK